MNRGRLFRRLSKLLILLLLAQVPPPPASMAAPSCSVQVKYIGQAYTTHEYEVAFSNVPSGSSLAFSMTNMTNVVAAGVKSGTGWKVVSQTSHTVNWTSRNSSGTPARLTVQSPDPVHESRGPAYWVGGCSSTANVTGNVRGPWGIPNLSDASIADINRQINANRYQDAIDQVLRDTRLDVHNIANGRPTYDAAEPGVAATDVPTRTVRIGKDGFYMPAGNANAAWLYSTIAHENIHATKCAQQVRVGANWKLKCETEDIDQQEVEAYLVELEFAGRTGVSSSPDGKKDLKDQLAAKAKDAKNSGNLPKELEDRVNVFASWDGTRFKPLP